MISSIIQAFYRIKIEPNMSEQERNDKESMICLTPKTKFFVIRIQSKKNFYRKRTSEEKGEWRIEEKIKRRIFNCSRYSDLEGPHNVN